MNDHSHFPDPADIEKRKFSTVLKTRASVADESPRQTILSVQRDINSEIWSRFDCSMERSNRIMERSNERKTLKS